MTTVAITRRIILGVGAALLVGGWAFTGYANTHPQAVTDAGDATTTAAFIKSYERFNASRSYHMLGVASMAFGAGLIGFGVLRVTET